MLYQDCGRVDRERGIGGLIFFTLERHSSRVGTSLVNLRRLCVSCGICRRCLVRAPYR